MIPARLDAAHAADLSPMSDFDFHELFPLGEDATPYRKLTGDHVGTGELRRRARGQGRARGADPAGAAGLSSIARICCAPAI